MKTIPSILITILVFLLATYFLAHPAAQLFGDVVNKVDTEENLIALTFDDGPGVETLEILDLLDKKDVKATFFIIGERAEGREEIIKQISDAGHDIGTHGLTHSFLYKYNEYEIKESKKIIEEIIGKEILFFRPPYGFRTPKTISIAKENGLITITWSSFPMDYLQPGEDKIVSRVLDKLEPGLIITLHDGPENREQTLNALSTIIDEARAQGYEFVTLTELIVSKNQNSYILSSNQDNICY